MGLFPFGLLARIKSLMLGVSLFKTFKLFLKFPLFFKTVRQCLRSFGLPVIAHCTSGSSGWHRNRCSDILCFNVFPQYTHAKSWSYTLVLTSGRFLVSVFFFLLSVIMPEPCRSVSTCRAATFCGPSPVSFCGYDLHVKSCIIVPSSLLVSSNKSSDWVCNISELLSSWESLAWWLATDVLAFGNDWSFVPPWVKTHGK